MTEHNPLTMIIAYLAGASTAEAPSETRAFYAATARASIRRLDADVAELKKRLADVERRLVAESKVKPQATRLIGPERTG